MGKAALPEITKPKKTMLSPLGDRVAIRPEEGDDRTAGGLYIPPVAKEKPVRGVVIAVGPGRTEHGVTIPVNLAVGDRVIYAKYNGTTVTLDSEEVILVRESEVVAVIY